MELDDTICYCFHVRKRKILNFLRIHRPQVASRISECGSAGTGCGWCIPFLRKYHRQWQDGELEAADVMTPDEYSAARGDYIRAGKGTPPSGEIPPPE